MPTGQSGGFTPTQRQQVEAVAEAAAEKAAAKVMRQTLLAFGLDPDDPVKSQENNAALREMIKLYKSEEGQKDRQHLRKSRVYAERVANFSLAALVTAVVTGAMGMLWAGYQLVVKGGHLPPPTH